MRLEYEPALERSVSLGYQVDPDHLSYVLTGPVQYQVDTELFLRETVIKRVISLGYQVDSGQLVVNRELSL